MSDIQPVKTYARGRWHRAENALMCALTHAGVVPNSYVLSTIGRVSGRRHSNPVTLVRKGRRRWLVAPYGAVPWVRNARAAGEVTLSRLHRSRRFAVREVSAEEAGGVLQRYVALAPATRDYFTARRTSPASDFADEAHRHPVFELLPVRPSPRR